MADSAFWRDLAVHFRAIPESGMLYAEWHYTAGMGRWELRGSTEFVENTFDTFARRAAFEIADAGVSDLLSAWLDALKHDGYNFKFGDQVILRNADGSVGPTHLTGSIYRLCETSANFCKKLEARALQGEFEEKHTPPVPQQRVPQSSPEETIAVQLQKLRDECRWTAEELAEAVGINTRTVTRHLSGETIPYPRNMSTYERVFGNRLKRKVVINKMP